MDPRAKLTELRQAGTAGAARLLWRKAVYRKVFMGRYGARAGDHLPALPPLDLRLEIVGADRFDEVLGTSPHLSQTDIERFKGNPSSVILIWDRDRLASSSWMTSGQVWVTELERTVEVPDGQHFSCRSWVDPDYRGKALLSHMIHRYATLQPTDDEIWGYVYPWNGASLAALQKIGWQWSGNAWSRYVFDQQFAGEERFSPRPIELPPRR